MLEFSDKPYDPIEPHPNRLVIRLAQQLNRKVTLKGEHHQMKKLTVLNADRVDEIKATGKQNVLFVANHSTHSDPQIMVEVQRQLQMPSLFMAAYDVFLRNKIDSWVMRKTGAFSVDRDGNDTQAMKSAVEALVEGEYGLTIFPEGNIYFMNDRVQPFMEGAAFIAMKAQRQLGVETPIYVVPVAIKATHMIDQRDKVKQMLTHLAGEVGVELDADDWQGNVTALGMRLLETRLAAFGLPTAHLDMADVKASLQQSAELIIEKLEGELEQKGRAKDTVTDRIRRLRRAVHQILIDPDREHDTPQANVWADQAMLALRIMSYSGDYLTEDPTLDRFAETSEKFMEDFRSVAQSPVGERQVFVNIASPITLSEYLPGFTKSVRKTIDELTRRFEADIQAGIDEANAQNPCEGSALF